MPESQPGHNSLNLVLENIGPIKTAEIELGRVTVLYGANATGKTTVARAIEYLIKLMNNISSVDELLINYGAKTGKIVLGDYEVLLERTEGKVNVTIKRGAGLIDTLVWVRYSNVRLIGVGIVEDLDLEALLKPVVKKYFGSDELKTAKEYDDYIYDVNHKVSALTGGWFVIQDNVYFNDGDYYYKLDHVAEGIKRAALIIAAKTLAEMLRELGRRPIIFVEGLEPLHIDTIEGILDELSEGNVPVIVETHSAFAIKYGVKNNWNVYVITDGVAYSDLTKPELFKREAVVTSEVGEIL